MNIVPPGLFRGAVAPPYAWEPRERDDWEYRAPLKFKGRFDESAQPGVPTINPLKARIDAIHQQIAKLREEVKQLLARQHMLVQAGKQQLAPKPVAPPPAGHWKGAPSDPSGYPGHWGAQTEALARKPMVPPIGVAEPGERAGHELPSMWHQEPKTNTMARQFFRERRKALNLPTGLSSKPSAPSQSPEILQIHQQVAAKRQQIAMLVNQLKQLRAQTHHESVGLTSNRRSCLRLLLK